MDSTQFHANNLRKGRYNQVGRIYLLTTCIADRRPVFRNTDNANMMLAAIRWQDLTDRFRIDAAVVMPDHVHIAGELRSAALANLMQSLKRFTAGHLVTAGVSTPVWQRGYHDHAIRDREDYRTRVQYLIENPVRAGLVEQAVDYPYLIARPGYIEY